MPVIEANRPAASAALREAPRPFCLGLSVLWRPAHRSWFAKHWPALRTHAPCLRSASHAFARLPWRPSWVLVFSAVFGLPKAESSAGVLRCVGVVRRPRAGAPGRAAQAVQPPASLVAAASVCLPAASSNAQCMQALCCLARCLTLQSTGHAPASRVMPVISNVRHRQGANTNARQSRRSFVACWATAARAARPASLASSARTEVLEATQSRASVPNSKPETSGAEVAIHVGSGAAAFFGTFFPVAKRRRGRSRRPCQGFPETSVW